MTAAQCVEVVLNDHDRLEELVALFCAQALREFELGGHLFDRLLKIADLQLTRKIGERVECRGSPLHHRRSEHARGVRISLLRSEDKV